MVSVPRILIKNLQKIRQPYGIFTAIQGTMIWQSGPYYDNTHVKWPIWDHIKVKNNNFIRNEAKHISIDFKMDDGCALSIVGGSLMTLIAVIFIGFSSILIRDFKNGPRSCPSSDKKWTKNFSFWNPFKRAQASWNNGKCRWASKNENGDSWKIEKCTSLAFGMDFSLIVLIVRYE